MSPCCPPFECRYCDGTGVRLLANRGREVVKPCFYCAESGVLTWHRPECPNRPADPL